MLCNEQEYKVFSANIRPKSIATIQPKREATVQPPNPNSFSLWKLGSGLNFLAGRVSRVHHNPRQVWRDGRNDDRALKMSIATD